MLLGSSLSVLNLFYLLPLEFPYDTNQYECLEYGDFLSYYAAFSGIFALYTFQNDREFKNLGVLWEK